MDKIVIYDNYMVCNYRLSYFFKDVFKKDNKFIMPTTEFLKMKRKLIKNIRDGHGYVCENDNPCDPHKFSKKISDQFYTHLETIQLIRITWQAISLSLHAKRADQKELSRLNIGLIHCTLSHLLF